MKLDYLHPYYHLAPEKVSIYGIAVTLTRAAVPKTSTNDHHIRHKEWSEWSKLSGFSLQEWQKLLRAFGISACTC